MSEETMKKVVDRTEWLARLPRSEKALFAMYSSATDCIVTDPAVMCVPVDDHMVHRGDGVFESFKCVEGNIYNLEGHLLRLERSCSAIGLQMPVSLEIMQDVIVQTVRAAGRKNSLVRLLVSRGLGTMGINPYACEGSEWYVVVYELPVSSNGFKFDGVKVALSQVPMKPGIFATVKTCNYLPNVMMKKEAIDLGVDFTITLDEDGKLGEGATENIGIVTPKGELLMPPPERVLAGTTAKRALALAQELVTEGALTAAEYRPISPEMAREAAEIHIYGTTLNITPVTQFDGRPVNDGQPGPIAKRLFDLLKEEMVPDSSRLTHVF